MVGASGVGLVCLTESVLLFLVLVVGLSFSGRLLSRNKRALARKKRHLNQNNTLFEFASNHSWHRIADSFVGFFLACFLFKKKTTERRYALYPCTFFYLFATCVFVKNTVVFADNLRMTVSGLLFYLFFSLNEYNDINDKRDLIKNMWLLESWISWGCFKGLFSPVMRS